MSSDSDGDIEFYDAEDLTPARRSRSASKISTSDVDKCATNISETDCQDENKQGQIERGELNESHEIDEFAEEEKLLLRLKIEAEERRKREDEEIQRKVQSLERRKKKDQDRKLSDLEKRKRKLQKLRQLVAEENTPQRPQELMSESMKDENDEEFDCESQDIHEAADFDSDALSVISDGSLHSNRSNNSSRLDAGFTAGRAVKSPNGETSGGTVFVPPAHAEEFEETDDAADCTLTASFLPDDLDLLDDLPAAELLGPEPDIVQSTKPRPQSLPTEHLVQSPGEAAPKPPPRRKKIKAVNDEDTGGTDSQSELGGVPSSASSSLATGGDIHSPTSTVLNLTKEFECSLDLDSATCGNRLVESKDDADTKAEKNEDASSKGEDELRPRTNSGSRFLTDQEILEQVSVLNLDTGEKIPLSLAEEKLPQGVNPLILHILRRTKEYSSDNNLNKGGESDDEEGSVSGDTQTLSRQAHKIKQRGLRMGKLLGRKMGKTMTMLKHAAEEVLNQETESEDEEIDGKKTLKVKAARGHTGPYDFTNLKPIQELSGGLPGAVWTMKFSHCGRLLATGGQDNVLRVWVLKESLTYFDEMRQKYSETAARMSPAYSQNSLNSDNVSEFSDHIAEEGACGVDEEEYKHAPFVRKPFCVYRGHAADLLDISWSKNYFLLSSSMDKTVRLWHISRRECLCCFQHIDFVTAIAFHPKDDRYFLSGSLDGKLRLWNIPDKKVALWNEVSGQTKLITAANFCQNGKFAVVGTYDGRCILYSTEQLKYYSQIFVRSTRGKNARGRKVTGVEPLPSEDKILVTSNDSRLRLYDLRDLTLTCKYKGCTNNSSQIKACFSSNGRYIICGSEDHSVYIWKTYHDNQKFTSVRRDRNGFWEVIRAHTAVVTAACFAPNPSLVIRSKSHAQSHASTTAAADDAAKPDRHPYLGEVLVSADFTGVIKVFKNKVRSPSTDEKRWKIDQTAVGSETH